MAVTDAELVHGSLGGSEIAFSELVRRYERPVFAVILRMLRDPSRAEEVAQDIFLKAFRALDQYDSRRNFSTWLLAIACHAAVDELRKRAPETVSLDDTTAEGGRVAEVAAGTQPAPDRLLERAALGDGLKAAIDRLGPEYRQLVALRYDNDMSYEAIAEITGLPIGTVKSYLHRARREMAVHLRALGWAPDNG